VFSIVTTRVATGTPSTKNKMNIHISNIDDMRECMSDRTFVETIKRIHEVKPEKSIIVPVGECGWKDAQFYFESMDNDGTLVYEFISTVN